MNFLDRGVKLPTHGEWVNVPGSPFQVMCRDSDIMGTVYIRINPDWAARWGEFVDSKDWEDPGAVS